MVRLYTVAYREAQDAAPRFRCAAGECLLMDNFRCAHGRDGYSEDYAVQGGGPPLGEAAALAAGHRLLWRLWLWTLPWVGAPEPWSSVRAASGCLSGLSGSRSKSFLCGGLV
jgi:hypothetical protein